MIPHTSNSRKRKPTYSDWQQTDGWLSGQKGQEGGASKGHKEMSDEYAQCPDGGDGFTGET